MSGLTHIAGGLLLGSVTIYYTNTTGKMQNMEITATFLAGCMLGALICDADEPDSIIGKRLWPVSLLFRTLHWIFQIIAWFLPKQSRLRRNFSDIGWVFAHRGLMHWPLTVVVFSTILVFIAHAVSYHSSSSVSEIINSASLGLSIGMISHLIYDFPSGTLPLFAPFSKKRFGLNLIESNKFIDKYIVRALSILGSIYLLFI